MDKMLTLAPRGRYIKTRAVQIRRYHLTIRGKPEILFYNSDLTQSFMYEKSVPQYSTTEGSRELGHHY